MIPGRSVASAPGPFLVVLGLSVLLQGALLQDLFCQEPPPRKSLPTVPPALAPPAVDPAKSSLQPEGADLENLVGIFNMARGRLMGIWDQKTGETINFLTNGVDGSFNWRRPDGKPDRVRLMADRMVVITTIQKKAAGAGAGAGEKEGEEEGEEDAKEGRPDKAGKSGGTGKSSTDGGLLGVGAGSLQFSSTRLYAEGNVRLETKDVVIEADAFFYDDQKRRGVFIGARGHADLGALTSIYQSVQGSSFQRIRIDAVRDFDVGGINGAEIPGHSPGRGFGQARILAFRADVLRALDVQTFEGDGVTITNCEYGVPHVGFHSSAARIYPAARESEEGTGEVPIGEGGEGGASGSAVAQEEKPPYIVETGGNTLRLGDVPVFPLPPTKYNTDWELQLPIRRFRPGNSSKFGWEAEVDWNVNWALQHTPLARLEAAQLFLQHSRLGFRTDYLSERGFGWGPEALYGSSPQKWEPWELRPDLWQVRGAGGYYAIDDHGQDRSSPVQFTDDDRYWGRIAHEQTIPYVGVLNVEYSSVSDPNFLREYFESVAKQEKEQENLVYFRRSLRDNIAVTGLYKVQTEEFASTVERLPEGKLFLLEQPVARTGIYSGLLVQGANLRYEPFDSNLPNKPPDSRGQEPYQSGRFDGTTEWAYPFGFGRYLRFRPFASGQFTQYDKSASEDDPIDRESLGAGITASQEYSRIFHLPPGGLAQRWFGITQLKHAIIPKVTYRNLYWNNVDPEELLQFDDVDTVSTDERVELSLRNELLGRSPAPSERPLAGAAPRKVPVGGGRPEREGLVVTPSRVRSIVDFEMSMDVFTHPDRDNSGDRFSLFDADFTFRPNERLSLRSRTYFDPNHDMRFQSTDSGLTMIPVRDVLAITVGERYQRDMTTFTYTQWTIEFSRKYLLDVYYGYDFEEHTSRDLELRITRILHKWAVEFVYSIDFNEGNNMSFGVNFEPIELLEEARRKHDKNQMTR